MQKRRVAAADYRCADALRARGAGLRSEAEVGERALAVHVDDEPHDLATAEVEQVRSLRLHLRELQSARLAAPAPVDEHEHALVVELAVLLRLYTPLLPDVDGVTEALSQTIHPPPAPGCRP